MISPRIFLLTITLVVAPGFLLRETVAQDEYRYWKTDWSFEEIDLGTLTRRLSGLGIDIPVRLDGTANVQFDVSVPWNALRTGKAYKFKGSLKVAELRADNVRLENFAADLNYENGKVSLTRLESKQTNGGSLAGIASAELIPQGDFKSKLNIAQFEIDAVIDLLAKFDVLPADAIQSGTVSAELEASGPVDAISDVSQWQASGDLSLADLRWDGLFPINGSMQDFKFREQRLEIGSLNITSPVAETFLVAGNGNVDLSGPLSFSLQLQSNDLPVGEILELASNSKRPLIDGKVDLIGTADGRFPKDAASPELDIQFAVASPQLFAAGVDLGTIEHDLTVTEKQFRLTPRVASEATVVEGREIDSITADYRLTESRIVLDQIDASIFGGQLDGNLSLSKEASGRHEIDANWTDIAPAFAYRLPFASRETKIAAETSGSIQWTVPADKLDQPFAQRGAADIQLSSIIVGGQRLGEATVNVAIDSDGLQASGEAEVFGGRAVFTTAAAPEQQTSWRNLPARLQGTQIELTDLSLANMLDLAGQPAGRLDGLVSGNVNFAVDDSGQPAASADLSLRSLTTSGIVVSRTLETQLTLRPNEVQIDSFRGLYAGGQLQAQGVWSNAMGGKNIRFRLVGADGNRLFAPFGPAATQWVGGRVTARGSIVATGSTFIEPIRITGSASVDKGTTFEIPVGDAHGPFVVQLDPGSLRWSADFPMVQSSLARGRVRGNLNFQSASGGRDFHMDSSWRVSHVDFESLLTTYVGTTTIGRGDVTGELTLGGRRIKGVRDLRGRFNMRLGGTDATAVPGLSTAGALLGATSLAGTRFGQGVAIGRIDRGNVLFKDLAMVSERVSVRANGSAGLVDNRLDFDVMLMTGNFQGQDALLQLVGVQTLTAAIPLGQINRLISDRIIIFELTGPMRDPIVRLMTAETAQANARRFAVQEALGVITANSLLFDD